MRELKSIEKGGFSEGIKEVIRSKEKGELGVRLERDLKICL